MFRSFTQAYQGLSRNPFAAFDCRILPFLFTWLWLGYIFFRPLIEFLFTGLLAPQHQEILLLDAIAILEVLVLWGLIIICFRFPGYLIMLYPVIIFMGVIIALSVFLNLGGKASWKGRTLEKPTIRWI